MSVSSYRRGLAVSLVAALVLLLANVPLLAGSAAAFGGRVLAADGVSPRPGVVVDLVDPATSQVVASAPADANGYFRVDAAPPGSYRIVAEAPEGAFLAEGAVTLEPGANRPVALALKASADTPKTGGSVPAGTKKLRAWQKWVIVGGIVVGALIVADAVSSKETPSSPF